jgi:putative flippase GtrA
MAQTAAESRLRSLWQRHGEKLRYLFVGGWNTLFGYLLFLLLLALLGTPLRSLESSGNPLIHWMGREYYVIVGWVGWVFAVIQSTVTMKYLVFRKSGRLVSQVFRAYFVYLPAQFLGSAILWFMVRIVGLTPPIGSLATIAVTTIFSYLGHKYFTFRTPLEVGEVSPEVLDGPDRREAYVDEAS